MADLVHECLVLLRTPLVGVSFSKASVYTFLLVLQNIVCRIPLYVWCVATVNGSKMVL